MPVRDIAPVGAPIWIDLATSDLDRACAFYAAVFGWTFDVAPPELGGYVTALCDGRPVGGLMANDPQWNASDGWTTYLHTADIGASIEKAMAAGAFSCTQPVEPTEIPGKGAMAVLADADGAVFALWQPAGHNGFEVVGEHGAPVYHQLTAREYRRALDFYVTVFGWTLNTVSDTDEFRYSTALFGEKAVLGVMDGRHFLQADSTPVWTVFLGADDVDKTIEVIVANGGAVVRPAEDTPYGRLAAVTDPTGAAFNLSSLSER